MAMSDPVTLLVPTDERFRAIGPELAGKFCLSSGGAEADAAALTDAVAEAVATVTAGDDTQTDMTLDFQAPAGQVEVTVRCGGQSSVVSHPLPTPKG
jgi:hypothetical protein